jgi:predicted XRE-type DNA-binding protein
MIVRQPDRRTPKQRRQDEEVQRAIEEGTFSRLSVRERQESRARASVRKESRRRAEGLGVTLGEIRRALGLTQAQVASRLGTKRPDISRLESGRHGGLTADRLIALLMTLQEAAGQPLQELLAPLSGPYSFASVEATIAGGRR